MTASSPTNVVTARMTLDPDFNFRFIIFLILSGVLAIFFLLYFNRLFASAISYALRTYTWHRHRIYIDIQALQISLLGGRIFFTGLRYHGSNETFLIQHGIITWRYWLRRVREVDILATGNANESSDSIKEKNAALPCRINVRLIGLEWFVYNRSPAYDGIIAGLAQDDPSQSRTSDLSDDKDPNTLRRRTSKQHEALRGIFDSQRNSDEVPHGHAQPEKRNTHDRLPMTPTTLASDSVDGGQGSRPNLPFMLQLFPVHIECEKPAVVVGNDNTKAILIVKANSISADVDASDTKTCDQYRQVFKVKFEHPVVEMKENEEFKEDQVTRATNARTNAQGSEPLPRRVFFRQQRRKMLSSLRNMVPYWRRSVESFSTDSQAGFGTATSQVPGSSHWQGLSRYLDDRDQDDKARWVSFEYGAETTILDSPAATLTVYWDAVTKVTEQAHRRALSDKSAGVNGSEAPAWGIHFSVKGGTMNYGPWADRLRADLQRVFFPGLSKDASPSHPLPVGAWRVATKFELFLDLEDAITLRIPIRESSKNWRWRGKEPPMEHQQAPNKRKQRNRAKKGNKGDASQQRPAGWLELKVPLNATVSYSMDMLASAEGYGNRLDIDLPSSELWSSVNHDVLWRSGAQHISCDLSNPLSWNTLRNWHFNIASDNLELYILRDHIFLLIDLVDDWATGPLSEYLVFTPYKYYMHLNLQHLRLFINVNDENIIDKATSLDDNAYLILSSPLLKVETCIPIDKFRPNTNSIPFDVRVDTLDMSLHTPQFNTEAAFLASNELGHADALTLAGSYNYNATTSPANTDTLILSVHGQSPYMYLYGFIVRYALVLKDNYFGDHVHFRTLDEYQEQLRLKEENPDAEVPVRKPYKKSNDLDVILNVKIDDPRLMLPTNLYSARTFLQVELANISADLRFTNYYMEMELDLSPLNLSLGTQDDDMDSPSNSASNTQLFIDGVRLFGHRTFGLPPSEPTYLCNWDVAVGDIAGACTAEFLTALTKGGAAFGFTFDDVENALVPYSSLIFHDITFARVKVESVRLWLHIDEAAFLLSTNAIDVNSNDWARSHYTRRANINVPNIQISCVNAESAARHKGRNQHPVDTDAYLQMDIHLAAIGRKYHFSEERQIQQDLVRREDQRTDRIPFLLLHEFASEFVPEPIDPPAQCIPPPPPPITQTEDDQSSQHSTAASRPSRRMSRQRSFLSLSSLGSSNDSVRQARTRRRFYSKAKQENLSPAATAALDNIRPRLEKREVSASTGHHSAFYSAVGENVKDGAQHPSVEFSSQYFAPHFPFDGILPDKTNVAFATINEEDEMDALEITAAGLEDIDPGDLSEDHAYSSTLIEFPSGITAFINPAAVRHATSLLAALQPRDPEDVLDSLQVSTMTSIFSAKKREHIDGDINDILVRLPRANIRFFNSSTLDSPDPSQEEQDQYDLLLSKVALITRTTVQKSSEEKAIMNNSRTSLNFRLGTAELSASERLSSLEEPQAAMMAQIDNVRVSLGAREVTYFDADIGSIIGSTASGKIEYLASLIHRTGNIVSDLEGHLTKTLNRQKHCLKAFTNRLLEIGESTNDPSFLIRPSAVLRSAPQHLRTYDSWKLIMRLRQIWATSSAKARRRLVRDCWNNDPVVPADAADRVISAFHRWRSWDLDDIPSSMLLKNIFENIGPTESELKDERPLLGACKLGEISLVLDPGPKQNKFGFNDLSARVDKKTTGSESVIPGDKGNQGPLTVLSLSCGDAIVNLNWEICELAEDVLRLYNRNQVKSPIIPKSSRSVTKVEPKARSALQVIFALSKGSMELETINLRAKTLCDGVKASFLSYTGDDETQFTSLIVNCNAVTSRLHSHSQLLGTFQLRVPTVVFSHELQETNKASLHTIKSTASSQDLTLAIKQDAIVLMEIVDLLLRDEIEQLYRLKTELPASPKAQKGQVKIADRLSSVRINTVLFLDGYSISVPLVQSLTYKITGVVARAACAANYGQELIFDFDIKENSHEMQINVNNEPRSISLLQIPPTNGRITSRMNKSEHVLTVLSSIEVIHLDASAIYSLLIALNRPQISSAIEEVQQQSKLIQGHIADIFGASEPGTPKEISKPSNDSPKLVYNIHLTLAGLQVFAKTSLKSELEPIAQILFSLDKVHMQASNRHDAQGPILKYPELHLNLRHIGLDVRRGREGDLRSYGSLGTGVTVSASSRLGDDGKEDWSFDFRSDNFDANLSPETISTVIDVVGYLGAKIKDLDTSRELDYLRRLRHSKPRISIQHHDELPDDADILDSVLASVIYHFELRNIRVSWTVANASEEQATDKEDLVLSIKMISFGTKTKKSATLKIDSFQLQTVPPGQDKSLRSLHSALLPEVIFHIAYVSTPTARRMAFQAVGESLDLRLTSAFIVPAANLVQSISLSMKNVQQASAQWNTGITAAVKKPQSEPPSLERERSIFGKKRLENLLIDADFAGAVVYISSKRSPSSTATPAKYARPSLAGKYGQFNADDSGSGAVLRSPGLAWKAEYRDDGHDDPSLYGEIKIDASSNILYPSVVPLVLDIMSSIKEVVSKDADTELPTTSEPPKMKSEKSSSEDNILTSGPSAVLGRLKLNLGLRICRQEFSLSCQPIARVAATTCFDNFYFTINTVTSQEHGNFFAISGALSKPQASVQHVYSRESTASFELETVTLSFMNSKHVSGTSGVSAIIKVSPMKVSVNAKQVQDFLLFREIWYPKEMRQGSSVPVAKLTTETSQAHLVQRYQQVAATAAFPWTATISIAALDVSVDLGQAIGKSVFVINDFWVSSKKTSDWEQNLCLGFDKIGIDCTGRLSGFIALQHFRLRTSIHWPKREEALNETPLVQASLAFKELRVKASFDYQAFLVADVTSLEFLMYNVRESQDGSGDRLVAIFDGEAVQIFGTTTSAAQVVALYQAIQKLVQERKENFESSLRDIEKFMRRKSNTPRGVSQPSIAKPKLPVDDTMSKSPISLDTDVVVTLKALNLGVFPSTFSDHQVFKMEALNAYARFAASIEQGRIHSILRMTLGQLRIGLAGVRHIEAPKPISEMSVDDVVKRSTGSRGGTILKVPRVEAVMETWQVPNSNHIEYVFKSAFEGKVEVGWNYSRISYIRGMWANHSKSLEHTWGRQLPMTAVKITGVPEAESEQREGEQQKITAEVTVPQSKYNYQALEPAIIETPQLRDMGEATPPLEWIGLHRDRLPNLTHQIVIVSLLELAGEVEDAYSRILGSS